MHVFHQFESIFPNILEIKTFAPFSFIFSATKQHSRNQNNIRQTNFFYLSFPSFSQRTNKESFNTAPQAPSFSTITPTLQHNKPKPKLKLSFFLHFLQTKQRTSSENTPEEHQPLFCNWAAVASRRTESQYTQTQPSTSELLGSGSWFWKRQSPAVLRHWDCPFWRSWKAFGEIRTVDWASALESLIVHSQISSKTSHWYLTLILWKPPTVESSQFSRVFKASGRGVKGSDGVWLLGWY